jgi:hypothetical protein
MKNTLIIAGDSWGCGELVVKGEDEISHGGITAYFSDYGYSVTNLSYPGGSNLDAYVRLKHYLTYNSYASQSIRAVLFFQTEFFREIWHFKTEQLKEELALGYATAKSRWIAMPYYRLSEVSQKWKIPIYIIGGCSDADMYDDFSKDFPGVQVVCQSLVNYLLNNNHKIQSPVFTEFINGWTDEFFNLIKPRSSSKDLELLLADMDLGAERIKQMSNAPEIFYPDGIHPNRVGHQKLFEFLINSVEELKLN